MAKLREGGKLLLLMLGTEKLSVEDLSKKYKAAGKEITLSGILQRLASLKKKKLAGRERRDKKFYYFSVKKTRIGKIRSKTRPVRKISEIHDTFTSTTFSPSSVIEKLTAMSLEEINLILTAMFPGERITLVHMEKLTNFVAAHGETIKILTEKGLIPSGSSELSKCRSDNQMLRKEVEELSSKNSESTLEMERLTSENIHLKKKLEEAILKVDEYVKAERSRVTARAQSGSQVHFGEH